MLRLRIAAQNVHKIMHATDPEDLLGITIFGIKLQACKRVEVVGSEGYVLAWGVTFTCLLHLQYISAFQLKN